MNMQNLMAQAQRMQRDLQKKKDEIDNMNFEAKNELVHVTMNGKKELIAINISKDIEITDLEAVEDMIVLAVKDAIKQIDKVTEEKMGSLGAGLGGLF